MVHCASRHPSQNQQSHTTTWNTVINNGILIDGTGAEPIRSGTVVIENGLIAYCGSTESAPPAAAEALVLDAEGGTIMPGLVEAHFHPTYFNVAELEDLDIKYPVEYVTLLASANAKLRTGHGMMLWARCW